ncbi:MAG: glycogen/starch/alpha-glucan phosphorylase [Fibrobacterota bacterium]|nr:glycogen/starch/alpha-glucan phosphorylase [Fibrobacterota bacterium]QQS05621.1 MAG: glycogen/starch/alpha-glucan phosphorylase [Fibrobacterota bacterium]
MAKEKKPSSSPIPSTKAQVLEDVEDLVGITAEDIRKSFNYHLRLSLARDRYTATENDRYLSLAWAVRDRLVENWISTQQSYYNQDVKRVYYFSLEFLMGRALGNSVLNLGLEEAVRDSLDQLALSYEDLREMEQDAGLGNGGLGRLAACFLDSCATLRLPAYGCGIRYEYGIFRQKIVDGCQVEEPDNWLHLSNPWEIPRPENAVPVHFYGKVESRTDRNGKTQFSWVDTEKVMATPYDTPVPGYKNGVVNNLRLWSAKATDDFDLQFFNDGDYVRASLAKNDSETISKVLYPNDTVTAGQELRLKQQYFFCAAGIHDMIRRHLKHHQSLRNLADKVVIQLNDTHPAVAIPELMRILMDDHAIGWDEAWSITTRIFAYTNHTLLPEALEKWPVDLFGELLPRHLQIIYEINFRFLRQVAFRYPGDTERLRRMSIIDEDGVRKIRMAHLCVVGAHSVNGVAALHSELLKKHVLHEFYEFFPGKFNNKTNGITPRRWLSKCNPALSSLITEKIGEGWETKLDKLKALEAFADDPAFQKRWKAVKREAKERLAEYVLRENGVRISPDALFDVQIKRLHEYKRQLLNLLHVIHLYRQIKANPKAPFTPRVVLFGAKAAPGYAMAKLIIRLINSVATVVNSDPDVGDKLKMLFLANYRVSLAEKIIPAADLSEQISTAGLEASGTGNMKLSLNGALTIGTWDGANIEIAEEVGEENCVMFGMKTDDVAALKAKGYKPNEFIEGNEDLRAVIELIEKGFFSPEKPDLYAPITEHLRGKDTYFLAADFAAYVRAQEEAAKGYMDEKSWVRRSILNTARMGKFSSDRTIEEYAKDIWGVQAIGRKAG